ncbi:uncharacterized protein LOC135682706 isoform X2 [Rhopilema esculentum]|uniref:uncharacterized protein LOC135682706 isoform X2 n=1 Tax=Rhopilema esculentum TaxID=499914 RepID=UPI0031E3BD30
MAGRSGNEVSDDDSSSDEEESARLREAVADSFIFETGKFSSKTTDSSKDFKSKPSLRNSRELDDGTEENGLQVSPEVKIFLSKRLSEFLDRNSGEDPENISKQRRQWYKTFQKIPGNLEYGQFTRG